MPIPDAGANPVNSPSNDVSWARLQDEKDELADRHDLFQIPQGLIYLDGNSLGALPKSVIQTLQHTLDKEWGEDLIQSWNKNSWMDLPRIVGEKIAKLMGAAPGQVICTDSTSVNLFKLLAASLQMNPGRTEILSQDDNFPTDLYMAQGLAKLVTAQRLTLKTVPAPQLASSISKATCALMLTHVNFRTGELHDIPAVTRLAHEKGALVIWDLSHSTGVLPIQLDADHVDMAVGCGYKYLNGGPGAPAYLYVRTALQQKAEQPLSGWMGHARPFEFSPHYESATGMLRYMSGTPQILSLKALDAALGVYDGLDMAVVRQKSVALTTYFVSLINKLQEECAQAMGLKVISPRDTRRCGSQVSLTHEYGYAIVQALIDRGVIGDFREPDVLRFGFTPLYTRFVDVYQCVEILREVLVECTYLEPRYNQRKAVT